MSNYKGIFIKNIYYMLSYAFKNLRQDNNIDNIQSEEFENIEELFATILEKGISNIIKQGLYKEYIPQSEDLHTLRGKINFSQSIKKNTLMRKKLFCNFDEFSENTLLNQILKSVILLLLKENIKKEIKKSLKKILIHLALVDKINLKSVKWSTISYQKYNTTYEMLINICRFFLENSLLTEEKGEIKVRKYFDEKSINYLYEKFVLEYYRKHFKELQACSKEIKWNFTASEEAKKYLPKMQSDIMLSHENNHLIIDTKFYGKTLQKQYDKESYHSSNFYQIFSYVKNKESVSSGNVSGMLLYAHTENNETPEHDFMWHENKISVRVLDLNTDWKNIQEKLDKIAHDFIAKCNKD